MSRTEHESCSGRQRRTAVLVLASIPAAHGMFASADSVALPIILLSDTVRCHPHMPCLRQLMFYIEVQQTGGVTPKYSKQESYR